MPQSRSLLLDLQLDLVVDRVGAMLLVLSGWRLARDHLHLHRSGQKKLLLILLLLLLLLLLLVLQRIGALMGRGRLRHHVVLHSLGWAALLVVSDARRRPLRLLLVVLVQLLDVQTATALVHVHLRVHWTFNLDGLSAVSLLSVKLTAVHSIDVHHFSLMVLATSRTIRCGDNGLTCWVIAKVCLVHQLFIERRVHVCVVVLDSLLVRLVDLSSVLEELVQDRLLLIVLNAHALALDSAALRSKHKTYNGQVPHLRYFHITFQI